MGDTLDYINNAIANGDCDSSGEIFNAFEDDDDFIECNNPNCDCHERI